MFKVTKVIHFCYGHRLLRYEGKCRHLHGHNAVAEIELSSASLDQRGMVVDFNEVKQKLHAWIDTAWDHKLLLHRDDPVIPELARLREPFVALDANPTAETLARLIFEQARAQGFPITQVRLWETSTSFATHAA